MIILPTDDETPFVLLTQTPRELIFINKFKNCCVLMKTIVEMKNKQSVSAKEFVLIRLLLFIRLFVFIISKHDRLELELIIFSFGIRFVHQKRLSRVELCL